MTADSMGGTYGLRNEMITWLIGRGRGDIAALSPADFQRPMDPPRCCNRPMLYRGEFWLCPVDKKRLPVEQFHQPTPKYIDWGDGLAVPFEGGIATLVRLVGKQVDVVYRTPRFGLEPPRWEYVVKA